MTFHRNSVSARISINLSASFSEARPLPGSREHAPTCATRTHHQAPSYRAANRNGERSTHTTKSSPPGERLGETRGERAPSANADTIT